MNYIALTYKKGTCFVTEGVIFQRKRKDKKETIKRRMVQNTKKGVLFL